LSLMDLSFWIPQFISITAVIISYVDMRRRVKNEREFSEALAKYVQILWNLKEEELRQQKDRQQWQKYKDIAKAFGWIWERFEEYEDEYDE